jgi:hypothetical protein
MPMDPAVGDFERADVRVEGKQIVAVGPSNAAGDASVIPARGNAHPGSPAAPADVLDQGRMQ